MNTYIKYDKKKFFEYVLLTIILLQLSRVLWYDFKGIIIRTGNDISLFRIIFYIYALLFIPIVLWWILNIVKTRNIDKYTLFLLFITIITAFSGLINGNNINYLIGDTYKFILFTIGFHIGRLYNNESFDDKILNFIYIFGILFITLRIILFYIYFNSSIGFIYGTVQDTYIVFALFIAFMIKTNIKNFIFLCIIISLVLAGQKRSLILVFSFLLPCIFVIYWKLNSTRIFLATMGFISSLFIFIFVMESGLLHNLSESHLKRINQTDWSTQIRMQDGRSAEAKHILEQLYRSSPYHWLIGFGSGAEYATQNEVDGINLLNTHSIHITPIAVLFRYGLIGLFIYLFITVYIISKILYLSLIKRRNKSAFYTLSTTYILASFILSLGIFGFIDDPLTGFCIGYFIFSVGN